MEGDVGERIKRLRRALGKKRGERLTQDWLAAEVGVGKGTVAKWETNVQQPSGENLTRLAVALQTNPRYLLTGLDPDRLGDADVIPRDPDTYYDRSPEELAAERTAAGAFSEIVAEVLYASLRATGEAPAGESLPEEPLTPEWLDELGRILVAAAAFLMDVNSPRPLTTAEHREALAVQLLGVHSQLRGVIGSIKIAAPAHLRAYQATLEALLNWDRTR